MTNLTSLVVGCYPSDDWQYFNRAITFVDAALSHSSHLQALTLDVPLECMERVFFNTHYFPVLEDLKVSIRIESSNESVHINAMSEIVSFINRQSSTLIRLSIDIPTISVEPSPLFYGLNKLLKLTMVSIGQPVERLQPGQIGSIDVFLDKHAACLHELRVHFYGPTYTFERPTPESFFSSPIFQLDLNLLCHLHLGLAYWGKECQASLAKNLGQYLSRYCCTLTELVITDYDLSLPIVQSLVSALGGSNMILHRLVMRVHYLSCDLLDLLAHGLPKLYELDLNFNLFKHKDDGNWDSRGRVRVNDVRFSNVVVS